jgi:hypothetical protein
MAMGLILALTWSALHLLELLQTIKAEIKI